MRSSRSRLVRCDPRRRPLRYSAARVHGPVGLSNRGPGHFGQPELGIISGELGLAVEIGAHWPIEAISAPVDKVENLIMSFCEIGASVAQIFGMTAATRDAPRNRKSCLVGRGTMPVADGARAKDACIGRFAGVSNRKMQPEDQPYRFAE